MSELDLPELPPGYTWDLETDKELHLRAHDTEWSGPGDWEYIAYCCPVNGRLTVRVWKMVTRPRNGHWHECGFVETLEQGAQYIWTLIQLGEADFTFIKDENDARETT